MLKIHIDRALADLGPLRPTRILDAGCGQGLWSRYLARRYPEAELLGLDIDADRIAACRALGLGARVGFEVLDLHRLDQIARYDLIVCMNAVHYAGMDDTGILARLAVALTPEGRMLFVGPMRLEAQPLHFRRFRAHPGYEGYLPERLREKAGVAGLRAIMLQPIVGHLGTLAKELARWVQPHPLWKGLSYPALASLAVLDGCFRPRHRGYYLLGILARAAA